jgi:hypothetical protein
MSYQFPALLETLDIAVEPRALFGRYFLALENEMVEHGIELRVTTPEALVEVYEQTKSSWPVFSPVIDHRVVNIDREKATFIIGYDRDGEAVVTHAIRLIDYGTKTIKEACEDLTFFYGDRAPEHREAGDRCSIWAKSAEMLTGSTLYIGAWWLHPKFRGIGVGLVVQDLARVYGASQWDFDYVVTGARGGISRPEVQQRYGFEGVEDGFLYERKGHEPISAHLLWSSREAEIERLRGIVDRFSPDERSVQRNRVEHALLTADRR